MIRYPLYRGGFIILPEPAIKTMYIIEKAAKMIKDEQLKLIDLGINFDVSQSQLNEARNEFLLHNNVSFPENKEEVITLLKRAGAIVENDNSYEILYTNSIEYSDLELSNDTQDVISYVRNFYENSAEMMNFINQLNITDYKISSSDEIHVSLINSILEPSIDPIESVERSTFIYEVSLLENQIKAIKGVSENEKIIN